MCTYPVMNEMAVAARPKRCSNKGGVISLVPYHTEEGVYHQPQSVCLKHAIDVATWKLAQNLKKEDEII